MISHIIYSNRNISFGTAMRYNILHTVCEEQHNIMNNSIDLMMLSSALEALFWLTELSLCFCETVKKKDWLESYLVLNMIMTEKSYKHHVQVISNVIQSVRNKNVFIHIMYFLKFQLLYYHSWHVSDLNALSESLRELLNHVQILCVSQSESLLELLSHCALNLHQFDMCHLTVQHSALKNFLEVNMKFICSVGFHDVQLTRVNQLETKWQWS